MTRNDLTINLEKTRKSRKVTDSMINNRNGAFKLRLSTGGKLHNYKSKIMQNMAKSIQ